MSKNRFDPQHMSEEIAVMKAEMHFPEVQPSEDINNILAKISSIQHIKRLAPDELNEFALLISVYSLYITQEENRLKSKISWCESNIKYIVGRESKNVDGYFQEKDLFIRSTEETARKLGIVKSEAEVKLEQIKYVSNKLQHISEMLKNLSFEKRKVGRLQ